MVKPSSAQREGLAALLCLAFGLALVRGLVGAETETGRVLIGVIFGGGLLLILAGWLRAVRHPEQLEVGDEAIRLTPTPRRPTEAIERSDGETLRFGAKAAGRVNFLTLSQPDSGRAITLHLFSRKTVRVACEAHGWRFDS